MTFEKLSAKQKQVFKWCYKDDYRAIICDGAVRSGKTICMITSFILWAMYEFNNAVFGICGKTVRSAERNIIVPLQSIVDITHYYKLTYTRSVNLLTIEGNGKKNSFYIFGGKDESSYELIQGITLSGVFLDEVVLMPRSFVEQALARTLSVENAKLWFNCNPDTQMHWFLLEWINKSEQKKALHLHFAMEDNPILTAQQIENAKSMYEGIFYRKYVLGEWVNAEGIIFTAFDRKKNIISENDIKSMKFICFTSGLDTAYSSKSEDTIAMTFAGITDNGKYVMLSEKVLNNKGRKIPFAPSDIALKYAEFLENCRFKYGFARDVFIDSADSATITELYKMKRQTGSIYNFNPAWKKTKIIDRLSLMSGWLATGNYLINAECTEHIAELERYSWSDKENIPEDRNDHTINSSQYAWLPYKNMIGV